MVYGQFISELRTGHWEEAETSHRPCLFLVYFTWGRNIYSPHGSTRARAAPTDPGVAGAGGELRVGAERGRLPLEPPGRQTGGVGVRLQVDTGATAPKPAYQ